jgi:hypothetical protein
LDTTRKSAVRKIPKDGKRREKPAREFATGTEQESYQERLELGVRAIRTARLHGLPRFDLRPIDVVVDHGSRTRPGLEEPIRSAQRSDPLSHRSDRLITPVSPACLSVGVTLPTGASMAVELHR